MKTAETLNIERMLLESCFAPNNPKLAKDYGVAEVTVGFQRDRQGHERVDFLSYDARKDIFKCYEIKVSMNDFNSDAKLSWYGNYNYLVMPKGLYEEKEPSWWANEVESYVGIIIIGNDCKKTVKKPKYVEISTEQKDMLKNSLIRSLFYQNNRN